MKEFLNENENKNKPSNINNQNIKQININIEDSYFLYNGNAMEILDYLIENNVKVDMIFTDPPYKLTSRGGGGNSGGMFQTKEVNNGKVFSHNDLDIEDWLPKFYEVLKDDTHCYIMTNNKNITHYLSVIDKSNFQYIKCLVWVKDNKIMGQTYMSQFEYIIMLRKGKYKRINHCGTSDVLRISNKKTKDKNKKPIHLTEKPIELTNILVSNSSNENDVVLDPFMGIGGCGVSCKLLNRKFIGIEIDKKYFNYSKERIINTVKENEKNNNKINK